ncbi:NACHT, LRR and PYD domains-containing protein 3 [Holothuria leucospilota]|uniref:NACHT, LRR and PYD domains-containing protein 3 n=1 Tax=Holothuria leucospilota TaxID=206669 RepID=A0A9Q1CRT4_HOLLE|nr:NACHT, LRR and PYD domains-containing protein 3 [Holothuria leucospilota]
MDNTKLKDDPRRWSAITSRHEIFMELTCEEKITIEGEPGFGKSILLLQCAQDWYTSTADSPLKDVHIFILLRLRDLKGASDIFDAIRMLLPDDLPLTSKDIKVIVSSGHWKVLIALDSYDEYSAMTALAEDDLVNRIIQGRILTACIIVITTRPSCLPKLQILHSKHFKLGGFDTGMQEKYIEKAIFPSATTHEVKDTIMSKLQSNAILSDICQVPFFFVTFAHMTSLQNLEQELHSVTSYFSFILACFFSHLENKDVPFIARTVQKASNEDPAQRLKIAKLAFEAFSGKDPKLVWMRSHLLESLGPSCYNRYIEAGILLEEQHTSFEIVPGSQADNKVIVTTYVRFFHQTFQEYYAAYHVAHLAENQEAIHVKKAFTGLGLDKLQYVLRFASGLRPTAARIVQDYLKTLGEDGRIFSVLCLLEQRGSDVSHTVQRLCEKCINILPWDSNLLQRSKIQLFQMASERKIPIVSVLLTDSVQSVDLNEYSICLSSGLKLPRLDTLQELKISFYLSTDLRPVARDILEYSGRCTALKMLKLVISYYHLLYSYMGIMLTE